MELETPNRWRQSRMRWTGIPFRGFTPPTFHLWWYNSSQTDCLPWLVFAINDWLESQISEYNCVIDSLVVDPIQCYSLHIWIWIWLYVQLNANDALIHQYSSNCLQWKEKSTRCFNVTNNFFVFFDVLTSTVHRNSKSIQSWGGQGKKGNYQWRKCEGLRTTRKRKKKKHVSNIVWSMFHYYD